MLLTTAGSLALWAVAVLSLVSLPEFSQGQQAELGQLGLPAESPRLPLRPTGSVKRSFRELGCRGVYNKEVFYELKHVCRQCYNMYQDLELLGLCRSECFTTKYFSGCLEVLLLDDQADRLGVAVRRLSGRK